MGDDRDDPKRENLADAAQLLNTNLRCLISTVGALLSASRDLLKRMPSRNLSPAPDQVRPMAAAESRTSPSNTHGEAHPSSGDTENEPPPPGFTQT